MIFKIFQDFIYTLLFGTQIAADNHNVNASAPIFTNHALRRMKELNLSEAQVLDAFNYGQTERAGKGGRWNALRQYNGYEIGVNYDRNPDGRYVIISPWVRGRR